MAVAALAARRAGGTPPPAHPGAGTSGTGAGTASTVPLVFAAWFESRRSAVPAFGSSCPSLTGDLLRWLTPAAGRATGEVLSMRDGWVYFGQVSGRSQVPVRFTSPAIWRVRVTGAHVIQAGPAAAWAEEYIGEIGASRARL